MRNYALLENFNINQILSDLSGIKFISLDLEEQV
jgi:hypothetical protein